jgi:Zn-dependent peptidase ImmA (M78 family)
VSDVASYLHKNPDEVSAWEAGSAWPTYRQLETLAQGLFHRPVALFFLPEPPEEAPAQREFRTLPDFDVANLKADTRYGLREARAYQQSIRDLTSGSNPSPRKIWMDLHFTAADDVEACAQKVRGYLGVDLGRQASWRSTEQAIAEWRAVVEAAGIFVFKRSFKQREISGFCLADDEFPIVMLNNSTPFSRQIFTLFHEVAHLLAGTSGITTKDGRFVDRMLGPDQSIEVACNKLAAEVLVPAASFPWGDIDVANIESSVGRVAKRFNVSREVILRRVRDRGLVDSSTYEKYAAVWAEQAERARGGGDDSGGNYYNTQGAYLGDAFLRLAFSRYRAGLIDVVDLSQHLGVKARHISEFEGRLAGRI